MTDIRDSRGKAGLRDDEVVEERMSLAQPVKRTEFSRPATAPMPKPALGILLGTPLRASGQPGSGGNPDSLRPFLERATASPRGSC